MNECCFFTEREIQTILTRGLRIRITLWWSLNVGAWWMLAQPSSDPRERTLSAAIDKFCMVLLNQAACFCSHEQDIWTRTCRKPDQEAARSQ